MLARYEYGELNESERSATFADVVFPTLNIPGDFWSTFQGRVGPENFRALRKDGELIGGLGVYRMGQWFGGRNVTTAGITVVGVAPQHRGQGAAASLLSSALRELHAEGTPLAALYASTQRLYRKVGFEHAGTWAYHELPLSSIGLSERPLAMQAVPPDRHEIFHEPARVRARRTNGNLERTHGLWEKLVSPPGETMYAYVIGDRQNPDGYVIFQQREDKPGPFQIRVRDMAALNEAAARTLWAFFAGHSSVAECVKWAGPMNDPLLNVTSEISVTKTHPDRWMLRILDVQGTLTGRGYPQGTEGELHLEIEDDLLPQNTGRYILRVGGGRGEVEPGGRGDLRTGIRGLAPLYSGLFPAETLRATGQLDGNDAVLATATRLFAGPEPWMPEIF